MLLVVLLGLVYHLMWLVEDDDSLADASLGGTLVQITF